ncbi:hypothetical protein CHS0354_002017 [Potamilus streckersoni]|uniref:GS catalytic domain-containing protein n=1 Tax=Potamilus streckersoni TaxID=2493646 RepID=A0AAE0T5M7_9BIVA|nr:hypothetical protein CHS0354_002017 [Potamilus streckersoni]
MPDLPGFTFHIMFQKIDDAELKEFLAKNQGVKSIDVLIIDLLGITRGKRIFRTEFESFVKNGIRGPVSLYVYDSAGMVPENLPYATEDGDPDFPVYGQSGSLYIESWKDTDRAEIFAWIEQAPGQVSFTDTRHILKNTVEKFHRRGIKPTLGIEIEFFLVTYDKNRGVVINPHDAINNIPYSSPRCYSMEDLNSCEAFFDEVMQACEDTGIKIETLIKEAGTGQFEVSLRYSDDLVQICDHVLIFKTIIKSIARKMGWCGCFMAKPFEDQPGSGLHMHIGMFDESGNNLFYSSPSSENHTPLSDMGLHAVGGMMQTMTESVAIFAPNANSYRRLKGKQFAPFNGVWGMNNRTVAVRIPNSPPQSTRVEHRLPGSDANPYLCAATLLESILLGIDKQIRPDAPVVGNAYGKRSDGDLPSYWPVALQEFSEAEFIRNAFGDTFWRVYLKSREAECSRFYNRITLRDYDWYLQNAITTKELKQWDLAHNMHPFMNFEKEREMIAEGKGAYVYNSDGKRFLDGIGGLWCVNIGYGRQELATAMAEQVMKLPYYSPFVIFSNPQSTQLAKKLTDIAPDNLKHVYFTLGGSEANDFTVRLVHQYNNLRKMPYKKHIISRKQAYHGMTYMAASVSGIQYNNQGYDTITDGIHHISTPNCFRKPVAGMDDDQYAVWLAEEFERKILEIGAHNTAAFIAEPIMGAGGVYVAPQGYHKRMWDICKKYDILYISDEVVTGFGRLGEFFASEKCFGIRPDIINVAKGITSGYVPLGATLLSDEIYKVLKTVTSRPVTLIPDIRFVVQ